MNLEKKGFYKVVLEDGEKLKAWYNPLTGHWLDKKLKEEIGFSIHINSKTIVDAKFIKE